MRALFLINSFVEDGPGTVLHNLLPALRAQKGLDLEVAALRHDGPLRHHFEEKGIQAHLLSGNGPRGFFGAGAVRTLLDERRPQCLVTVLPRAEIAGRLAARHLSDLRLLSFEHGPHAWDEKGFLAGQIFRLLYFRTLDHVDRIVCVSDFVREDMVKRGVPSDKLVVIPNGLDTDRFQPARPEDRRAARAWLGLPAGETFVIGMAGGLRQVKGPDVLLKAVALLEREASRPARSMHLVFAGDGPLATELSRDAESAGMKNRMTIRREIPYAEMPRFYKALDLYVQPSRSESFGMAAIEAMASGLPAIVSAVGGLRQHEGQPGVVLVEPDDPQALAREIARFMTLPVGELHQSAEAIRPRVVRRFDVRNRLDAWEAVLRGENPGRAAAA